MDSKDNVQEGVNETRAEHVVIIGGGFAGWYAARGLALRLPREHRITLVDRVDHMLYTPMLTEVAGGTVRPSDITVPATTLSKRVAFIKAEVVSIDIAAKSIALNGERTLQATQLVLALGATTNYHQVSGARENSFALKTIDDARATLARLDDIVTLAANCADPKERRNLLTILVAGGGYTGVETMAAVSEHLRRKASAANIDVNETCFILIEPTERLMHETTPPLAAYSQQELERNGVRVLLNTGVKSVDGRTVQLNNGSSYQCGLLIWDTGITPNQLLETIDVPKGKHHGVVTDQCFRVPNRPGVWAIGDCAEIPQEGGKGSYAPTAQNATREGTLLAQNINAVLRGRAPRPFRYKMLGQLALLSHRRAIAELLGIEIKGLLAWAIWWSIYIVKLPYLAGRVGVARSLVSPQSTSSAASNSRPLASSERSRITSSVSALRH